MWLKKKEEKKKRKKKEKNAIECFVQGLAYPKDSPDYMLLKFKFYVDKHRTILNMFDSTHLNNRSKITWQGTMSFWSKHSEHKNNTLGFFHQK